MPPRPKADYIINRDTREKRGYWTFAGKKCVGKALKTGDYTIKGYENQITIDRKRNVSELAQNVCQRRFWDEVDRMQEMVENGGEAYFVLEFSQNDIAKYPWGNSGVPWYLRKKIRIRPPFIFDSIRKIEKRGIKVIYGNDREGAINEATSIFKRFLKKIRK